jgi:type II secretory ATPase GspE/PulE/Tfp pilus assembly ATPase PilB-like protein
MLMETLEPIEGKSLDCIEHGQTDPEFDNSVTNFIGDQEENVEETLMDIPVVVKARIGELLIAKGVITPAQFDIALRQQRVLREQGSSARVGEILISMRFADENDIEQAVLSSSDGVFSGGSSRIILAYETCRRYEVSPVRIEDGVLVVKAARRLTDNEKTKVLNQCLVPDISDIRVMAGEKSVVLREIARNQALDESLDVWIRRLRNQVTGVQLKGFLDNMIAEAERLRASDIHLFKLDEMLSWIGYRIDGDIRQMYLLPTKVMAAVFTRIKSESGMDASESRRAQDGRISIEVKHIRLDVRVAAQPIAGGEKLVMRLLSPTNMRRVVTLFDAQPKMLSFLSLMTRVEGKAGGFFIVSGTTGSGKSTTIYAVAQEFERDRINVMTVEDPVEYTLPFCSQIQINQLLDQRATDMERSLLRQDPDVIIFGELRDANFANAALKLTESGHLCLATIHANDASQTIERLQAMVGDASREDMMFVMANYLKAVVNQKLVKRLCACAMPSDIEHFQAHINIADMIGVGSYLSVKRPVGCKICNFKGYFGRVVAHESLLIPDDEVVRSGVRTCLMNKSDIHELSQIPGVTYISRVDSLHELVEAGIVSLEIAAATLGMPIS